MLPVWLKKLLVAISWLWLRAAVNKAEDADRAATPACARWVLTIESTADSMEVSPPLHPPLTVVTVAVLGAVVGLGVKVRVGCFVLVIVKVSVG